MTKLLRTQADMMQAYRDRIAELGLTHATVDAISGLPDGYTSKLMCSMKNLGPKSVELLNGALGMAFVVAVDEEQAAKVEKRWVQRARPLRASIRASIEHQVPMEIEITPELQRKLQLHDHLKRISKLGAKLGAKRRNKIMGKRRRQRAASHAARIRWQRERERRA